MGLWPFGRVGLPCLPLARSLGLHDSEAASPFSAEARAAEISLYAPDLSNLGNHRRRSPVLLTAMSTSARSSAWAQSGAARRLRVLVAEDNQRLAAMVAASLTQAGHAVVVVHDGYSALSFSVEQHFDALLTDLQMPGLSGDIVAERVRRIRPELPILLMTAFDDGVFLDQPWSAVIRKPFTLDALVAAVERVALVADLDG